MAPEATRSRAATYWTLGTLTGIYAAVGAWSYYAWYRDHPVHAFRLQNDGWLSRWDYAGGADKIGHMFGADMLMQVTAEILEFGGTPRGESTFWAAVLSWAAYTAIEVKDGFHYSFSYGDMIFNALGILWGVAARQVPGFDQAVSLQWLYTPSEAYLRQLRIKGSVNLAEDYTGQMYVLSWHLASLSALEQMPWLRLVRYLDVTVGFRALHYNPWPLHGEARRQELCLGLGLDVRQVLRDLFFRHVDSRSPAAVRAARAGSEVATTLFRFPYTTWFPIEKAVSVTPW